MFFCLFFYMKRYNICTISKSHKIKMKILYCLKYMKFEIQNLKIYIRFVYLLILYPLNFSGKQMKKIKL